MGSATARVLSPPLQALTNTMNARYAFVYPGAELLAIGVAQGQIAEKTAREWASYHGTGDDAFSGLIAIANGGPALGYAYQAWRRGFLDDGEFETALKRTALEPQWFHALKELKAELLDDGAIATATHRGIMASDGLLLREPPSTPGKVPFVPQSKLSSVEEFAGHGIDPERGRILVGNTGLPLPLGEMLQLLNRGEVTVDDVQRSIAYSNLRNEYMDVALALRRRLLTPHEYEEAALRGVLPQADADAGAALSGMEPQDAAILFEILGRPLNVRAITTGLARGGQYGGTYDDVPEPYRDAIRRSNIRPEYARLAYANRYSLPSVFVMRGLTQDGTWSQAKAEKRLLEAGWIPEDAAEAAAKWSGGTVSKAATPASTASKSAIRAVGKSYREGRLDRIGAEGELVKLGLTSDDWNPLFVAWDVERESTLARLTDAQVKKAIGSGRYTLPEAVAILEGRGYTSDDALTYLTE